MKRVLIKLLRHYTKPHRKLRLFTSGSSQSVRADQQDGEFLHLCAAQYSTYCEAQALRRTYVAVTQITQTESQQHFIYYKYFYRTELVRQKKCVTTRKAGF